MSFQSDCESVPHLAGAAKPGLRALRASDRAHISKKSSTRLTHSVDIDRALRETRPVEPRWDYGIARESGMGEHVYWVEIHPASGGASIYEIERKLAWLQSWLATTPMEQYRLREVVWIASGKSAFTSRHPKIKALAAKGLHFAGGHLEL